MHIVLDCNRALLLDDERNSDGVICGGTASRTVGGGVLVRTRALVDVGVGDCVGKDVADERGVKEGRIG